MGLAVVEFSQSALVSKRLRSVAFFAVGAELAFVDIFMTFYTTLEWHIGKFLELSTVACFLFVALNTGHILVFSAEREIRFVVVEFFCGFKLLGVVAFCAIFSERFLVHVLVAINALLPQAEERFILFFQLRFDHEIGRVATAAVNFFAFARPSAFVPAGQFVARQIVLKGVFIKTDHVEFPSVVIAVTFCAILSFHIPGGVVALVSVYP